MVEIELSVLAGQCLKRRLPDKETVQHEVAAWERQRNEAKATVQWRFTTDKARTKLQRLYPSQPVWWGTTLRQFWEQDRQYADAQRALEDWHAQVSRADWATPADVKAHYGDASILKGSRVVFNIWGNKYRVVAYLRWTPGNVSHSNSVQMWSDKPAARAGVHCRQGPPASRTPRVRTGQQKV